MDDLPEPGTAEFDSLPWPAGFPFLRAADAARRPLIRWFTRIFPSAPMGTPEDVVRLVFLDRLGVEAMERFGLRRKYAPPYLLKIDSELPPAARAVVWNGAAASCGYEPPPGMRPADPKGISRE